MMGETKDERADRLYMRRDKIDLTQWTPPRVVTLRLFECRDCGNRALTIPAIVHTNNCQKNRAYWDRKRAEEEARIRESEPERGEL